MKKFIICFIIILMTAINSYSLGDVVFTYEDHYTHGRRQPSLSIVYMYYDYINEYDIEIAKLKDKFCEEIHPQTKTTDTNNSRVPFSPFNPFTYTLTEAEENEFYSREDIIELQQLSDLRHKYGNITFFVRYLILPIITIGAIIITVLLVISKLKKSKSGGKQWV